MSDFETNDILPSTLISTMQLYFPQIEFNTGESLRRKGEHYRNMYIILDGVANVLSESKNDEKAAIQRFSGSPIGEIGFLRGTPANADVSAATQLHALHITDELLSNLKINYPDKTALLFQYLATTAEDRHSYELTLQGTQSTPQTDGDIDIFLVRDEKMLEEVLKLRYQVYCNELHRDSPHADHKQKILTDSLDSFAYNFIATQNGEAVGTLRMNYSDEGSLGILENMYGMSASEHHPNGTGICTKFIVKKSQRGGPTAMKLVSSATKYGLRSNKRECYIDSIPALQHYYRAMGFKQTNEIFFHTENGPSIPMKVDLQRYGKQLTSKSGVSHMIKLYLKAKALKTMDKYLGKKYLDHNKVMP